MLPAALQIVIRKGDIGADEDIIADSQAIPKLNPILDRDAIANDHIAFDEAMRADNAIHSHHRRLKYDSELRDSGTRPNSRSLNIGEWVNIGGVATSHDCTPS